MMVVMAASLTDEDLGRLRASSCTRVGAGNIESGSWYKDPTALWAGEDLGSGWLGNCM